MSDARPNFITSTVPAAFAGTQCPSYYECSAHQYLNTHGDGTV